MVKLDKEITNTTKGRQRNSYIRLSVNPIFFLPCIIMDLSVSAIAEWATLLVDIRCPRSGS